MVKFMKIALCLLPAVVSASGTGLRRKTLIGGSSAGEGEIPEFVYFETKAAGGCGGTLISDDEVLTTTSCVIEGAPRTVCIRALDKECDNSLSTQVDVLGAYTDPDYDAENPYLNNLAIIRLSEKCSSVKGEDCDIMTLNTEGLYDMSAVGTTVKEYGLGTETQGTEDDPNGLRKTTTMESIEDSACQDIHGKDKLPDSDTDQFFCLQKSGEDIGACDGDYGGPGVITEKGKTTQVGVMVRMSDECGESNGADVMLDLVGYQTFIEDAQASDEITVEPEEEGCGNCFTIAWRYIKNGISFLFDA